MIWPADAFLPCDRYKMNIKQITCFFILLAVIGLGPAPVTPLSPADTNAPPKQNPYGPTLLLGYDQDQFKGNPISSFMYFVPLISPTPVYFYTSTDNTQQHRHSLLSAKKSLPNPSLSNAISPSAAAAST